MSLWQPLRYVILIISLEPIGIVPPTSDLWGMKFQINSILRHFFQFIKTV